MLSQKQIEYEELIKRFDGHVKHFELIDAALEKFSRANGFALEKNQWHRPCRLLRKRTDAKQVIEILQEGDWKKVLYRDDLPHTLVVASYAVDEKRAFVYRKNEEIASFVHFLTLQNHLQQYLEVALVRLQEWTTEVILRDGTPSRIGPEETA